MAEEKEELFFVNSTKYRRAKLRYEILPFQRVFLDWSDLPKTKLIRAYRIDCRSLNTRKTFSVRVSRRFEQFVLEKVLSGHFHSIKVCSLNEKNEIIDVTEEIEFPIVSINEAPTLRVAESNPDFIRLEWIRSDSIEMKQIKFYKLFVNNEIRVILTNDQNQFVLDNGQLGAKYKFRIETVQKNGKIVSSVPVNFRWPTVTFPERNLFVNGEDETIFSWFDSLSINNGTIESYRLLIYDSKGDLLKNIGTNDASLRKFSIRNFTPGIYFYVFEVLLKNSNKTLRSKPVQFQCGKQLNSTTLSVHRIDAENQEKLKKIAQTLIPIRDRVDSEELFRKAEKLLEKTLTLLNESSKTIRLNLMVQLTSTQNDLSAHRLWIDDQRTNEIIPWFNKNHFIQLPSRQQPYELSVLEASKLDGIQSNKILIESIDPFECFCAHFHHKNITNNCSYLETFLYEKELKQKIHQGYLKTTQKIKSMELYDFRTDQVIHFPSEKIMRRLTIVLFYVVDCSPSMKHLTYFSHYATMYQMQHHYVSINCKIIDEMQVFKKTLENYPDIQCYTDFSSENIRYEKNQKDMSIVQLLSLEGVPFYYVLDFSGILVWKGRLSIHDQSDYNHAFDRMIDEVNKMIFNDNMNESELDEIDQTLRVIEKQFSTSPINL